jgi:hypothetical protein
LEGLAPLPTEVVEHSSDPPSPWGGYKLCITDPPKCSHLLIVQDDATLAANFVPAVKQIAKAKPDAPVCLFLARLPRDASHQADKALHQNRRYVNIALRSFLPIVAVLWPREKLLEFAEWAEQNPRIGPGVTRSDDAMAGRWKLVTRQTVYATVPSIVQHPDVEPSTIGRTAQWGRDRGRVAAHFTDDASVFDWMQT